ncbi:MAG TPA: glutathione S-transferase family protein [Kofleriaceae bacterium]|nr:glutathione S-transferase family protein [Kofleriaceae bacterium]
MVRAALGALPMTDFILHHFASSPFSEKIRWIFGFKHLAWRSVDVPMILPKPDVVALTGGYRRTPFLQIGADIYCDTALMARVIDQLAPEPALYPAALAGTPHIVAQWADSALFWAAIPFTSQPTTIGYLIGDHAPTPEFFKALMEDRAAMIGSGRVRATHGDAAAQLTSYLSWLEATLAGPFVLGEQPCIADFAAAQSIWFMRLAPPVAATLAGYPRVTAWFERVAAFGHGTPTPLSSADAIAIAAGAAGHAATTVQAGLGFEAGAPVTVAATDYASDATAGSLVGLSHDEVVVERKDGRAGVVHVHFPRIGYQVKKAKS